MSAPNQIITNFPTPLNSTCTLLLGDASGYAIIATCTGTPPTTGTATTSFQHGCIMIQTDSGTGTIGVYENTGSIAAPDWNLLATSISGQATSLVDSNEVTALDVGTTASAVNNIRVTDAAANKSPIISVVGASSTPGLFITAKSTGVITLGTASAVALTNLQDFNYIATETGSNNALVASLPDANGNLSPIAAGMRILLKTGHSLQVGANTLNINGQGTKSIFGPSLRNIKTVVVAGAILDLVYDGTQYQIINFQT